MNTGNLKTFLLTTALSVMLLHGTAQQTAVWTPPHSLESLEAAPVALIPFPNEIKWTAGFWKAPARQQLFYSEAVANISKNALKAMEQLLKAEGAIVSMQPLPAGKALPVGAVLITIDTTLPVKAEGYRLSVGNKGVTIRGKDAAGAFYAVQTFRQLLRRQSGRLQARACEIEDGPAFGLRGFMHDTGRNFREISSLKNHIDLLARYKYNTFHWHLTDNPAWRPQSKVYPLLNDPKLRKPGRNPEGTYSFDDIRDVIAYARERCITIIPELDMPGHSAFFEPTFGFKMGTPEGMDVLEKLIDEFCREIPATDCPILHIGSDEVHIKEPDVFMRRMADRVKANGRRVMVWNPGLKAPGGSIEQIWYDKDPAELQGICDRSIVDSYQGYLNGGSALGLVQRYFFHQVCGRPRGDGVALGGILCCWPDTRVDDKRNITLHNPVWPGALTFSEAVWCGRPSYVKNYRVVMPESNTLPWRHFNEFEKRLAVHRDRYFANEHFPFAAFSHVKVNMAGPFTGNGQEAAPGLPEVAVNNGQVKAIPLTGGTQSVKDIVKVLGLADSTLQTVYFTMELYSETARQAHALIGFEVAARSDRLSAGIPAEGKWDANGGDVWINNQPLPAPKWKQPGANRYLDHTWEKPGNEVPFTDEEFYWSRPPAVIPLKKGWNRIVIGVPRTHKEQNWEFAFVPVKKGPAGKWVEDLSLRFR